MVQKRSASKYNEKPYLFITFGNKTKIRDLLLILIIKLIPSPGCDSGGLGDNRSKTAFTRLGGHMGTRTGTIPCVLFIRRHVGVSPGHKGWGWLFGNVFDPDKFPDSARFGFAVFLQFDLAKSCVSAVVHLKRERSATSNLGPIAVRPPLGQVPNLVCRPPKDASSSR